MSIETLKTSEEWQADYPARIYDPDGWDRSNFHYSWHKERITFEEFERRANLSSQVPWLKKKGSGTA